METVKETLSKDQLEAMEDFSIKESEKIVARLKELKEQFETFDAGDTKAQLDTVVESKRLGGKLEGIRIMIKELERLAEKSYCIMRWKEECMMITLTILVAILLGVIVVGIALFLAGGISLLFTFGDVIVAGLIIYAIFKHIYKNHHKN